MGNGMEVLARFSLHRSYGFITEFVAPLGLATEIRVLRIWYHPLSSSNFGHVFFPPSRFVGRCHQTRGAPNDTFCLLKSSGLIMQEG